MKTFKIILFIFIFSFLYFTSFASFSICDNSELNISWESSDEICNGGKKINNIDWINSFSGTYSDIWPWIIWNNFNNTKTKETKWDFFINWFLWSHFSWRTIYNNQDLNPVGYLWRYIWADLLFDDNTYKYFSPGEKLIIWENQANNNSTSNSNSCIEANKIENINIEIKTSKKSDYLELSWDENSDKTKIIQISPRYKEYYLDSGNNYINTDLVSWDNYSYFVVSYNDCWNLTYSDLLSLRYEKINTMPYLELIKNTISLKNFDNSIWVNPKLHCTYLQDEFINKNFDFSYAFQIPEKYLNLPFYCFWEYFSNSTNKLEKTETYINNILNQVTLTNSEAIEILTQTKDSKLYFEEKLYYLYKDVVLKEDLTYFSLALLALNLDWWLIIEDKDLALKIAKDLWIIKSDVSWSLRVYYDDFINTLANIKTNNLFDTDVLKSLENKFNLSKYQIFLDLEKLYYINVELAKLSNHQNEILINCYQYIECIDNKLFKSFDEKIYTFINQNEYKYLWINIDDSTVNWNEYIKLIYKVFSKNWFYSWKYSFSELDLFTDILLDAVFYEQDFRDKKLDYFSYNRLNISLVNSGLSFKIEKLIGFYDEINYIYKNINDKSKLFSLLKNYLN